MPENLTAEEVAVLIRARRLLKQKGLAADTDVKTLCDQAGISRKTGYQWEKRLFNSSRDVEEKLRRDLELLSAEHARLKKDYDDVHWENRGRKLAWEIHEVDALLAEKKSTIAKGKNKKR
jgi:transcriptional regulator with XRE-family HTH domain